MINIAQNVFVLLIISSKFCFSKTRMLSLSTAISHMRLWLTIAPLHALLPNIAQKICFPHFTSDPRYRLHGRKANNSSSRTRRDCSSQPLLCTALLRQPPPEGLQTVFPTGPAGSKNIHPLLEFQQPTIRNAHYAPIPRPRCKLLEL